MIRSVSRALLDLLFPPKCIYCNALVNSSRNFTCPRCFLQLPWIKNEEAIVSGTHFSHCVSAAWYEGEIRKALLQYKFFGKCEFAEAFAIPLTQAIENHYANRYDLISWVPISQETLKTRGYDQAFLLADAVSKVLRQNTCSLVKQPIHKTAQSTLSSAHARHQNVKGCFTLNSPIPIQGKRILLIDDVITTGSTLEEIAKLLTCAGAVEVLCATFCRARLTSTSP
jgi:ComF family protein